MIKSLADISIALTSVWITSSFWTQSIAIKIILFLSLFVGLYVIQQHIINLLTQEWSLRRLLAGLTGAAFGVLLANLVSFPVFLMMKGLSEAHIAFGVVISLFCGYIFASIFIKYEPKILQASIVKTAAKNTHMIKILDTNTIIDGRINNLVKIHFIEGLILIPDFVLDELKKLADGPDVLKQQRAKNALKVTKQLIDEYDYVVRYETGVERDVDQSLLQLARELNAKILTSDSNLIDLATLKEIPIININEISMAFQMTHLRGEKLTVKIIEAGQNPGQGLAYTDDGMMIIVTGGMDYIDETVEVVITRQLQSKYGIMLFADIV